MFEYLTEEKFYQLASSGKFIAVYKEFSADCITPIHALHALNNHEDIVLLESADKDPQIGRYSCLGFDPLLEVKSFGSEISLRSEKGVSLLEGDPMEILRRQLKKYACEVSRALPGFVGGAAGFFSYDAVRYFEDIPDSHSNPENFPDVFFQFFQKVLVFDHMTHKLTIVYVTKPEGEIKNTYQRALENIQQIYDSLSCPQPSRDFPKTKIAHQSTIDMEDKDFHEKVAKAKDYIKSGEAFQVVISRSFRRPFYGSSLDVYRALRMTNPSPYMFYFKNKDFSVVGASPEKFASLKNGALEAIPIAGTYPIQTEESLEEMTSKLRADPKEDAEHMMLVDLARNDLGKVAKTSSVRVENLKTIQKLTHVLHLVSHVKGQIKNGLDCFDLIKAAFPAGTLSGAPKIRAMEIIDELEQSKRNLYGGAICMIDSFGNLDSCIAIRMAIIKKDLALVRAGAGIVADSVPEKEAEETRYKAKAVLHALDLAEAGL
ncbi:MAG: anthranilate synthase component I family protein [Simkaniaceae bacterium]